MFFYLTKESSANFILYLTVTGFVDQFKNNMAIPERFSKTIEDISQTFTARALQGPALAHPS